MFNGVSRQLRLFVPLFSLSATALAGTPALQAERWAAAPDRIAVLTVRPAECLVAPAADGADLVEIGRVAFRTPVLLGGQAARAGLACESCHRGGRDNPAFLFPGLSGAPGTADVTSSLMSSHRGNGVFDPKQIPDLTRPGKVSRDARSPELRQFIRGLIVEEFDGAEPPARVLDGLAAYVRALRADACPEQPTQPLRVAVYLDEVKRAQRAALSACRGSDPATARLMLAGARAELGLIDERFAMPGLEKDRQALRDADLALAAIQQALDRADPNIEARLAAWNAALGDWAARISHDESLSLFNPARLRQTL